MTEQTDGNGSNTTAEGVAKNFVDLVFAGVKDAVALAGDEASNPIINPIMDTHP